MRAVFIALFFSLLCGRAGGHFTESRLRGEGVRSFTQATTPGEAGGFKDERLGLTEETRSEVLWAGWLPVMEERTRTVSGVTGVTTRRWFQWGADLSGTSDGAGGIGGLVGIIEEDGAGVVTRTLLPVQDGLGNITAVIDQATGRTVARYDYGPFGEPLAESGEVDACPFRWQTKWYDAESQHYYFGYRHYDPRFGRWLSRDPMGEAGGFNLYAYCGNDPVNRHDPLGFEGPSFDGVKDIFEKIFEFFLVDPVKIEGDKELLKLRERHAPTRVLEISKRNLFDRAKGWSTIKAEQDRIHVEEVEGLRRVSHAEEVLAEFIYDSRAAIPLRKERFAGLNAEQSRFEQEVNFALVVVILGRSGIPLLRDALAAEGPLGLPAPRPTLGSSLPDVSKSVFKNGSLPDNFITKADAKALGWNPKAGNLDAVAPGRSIGGDVFGNKDGLLPSAPGRTWFEADLNYTGGYRGGERLLYSNDGKLFNSGDHYKTFQQIGN